MIGLALSCAPSIIGWFAKPAGRAALIALGVLLAAGYIHHLGYASASAQCEERALRSQLAAAKADLKLAQDAEADARTQSQHLEAAVAANAEKVRGLEAALARRPDGRCVLTPDDARRLRNIR